MAAESIGFGVNEETPTGLAWHQEKLYMIGKSQCVLYVLDTTTGLTMPQPKISLQSLCIDGEYPEGLASANDNLFLLCRKSTTISGTSLPTGDIRYPSPSSVLYNLNSTKPEVINRVEISIEGQSNFYATGLRAHDHSLYIRVVGSGLYTVNAEDGKASPVDPSIVGPTHAESSIISVSHNGYIYSVGQSKEAYLCVRDAEGNVLLPRE